MVGVDSKGFDEDLDCTPISGKTGLCERVYSMCSGSSFSMIGVVSRMACSGTFADERFGLARLFDSRNLRGVSPRSMLDVRNLTLPEGDRGGVIMLSSGSSGITWDARAGSDIGTTDDVSLSPDSDMMSSVVFDLRRLMTRFFFLRLACERERPDPRDRPVVEGMLANEGREGKPASSESLLPNV